MTEVRVSHEPHKIVDIPDKEIADLIAMGYGIEYVTIPKQAEPPQAAPKTSNK